MSLEMYKEAVRWFFESDFNDVTAGLDQHITKDFRAHSPAGDEDRATYIAGMNEILRVFPDVKFQIKDIVAEADKVATRWVLTGTQQGEYMGIPPTRRTVSLAGVSIDHMRDSLVAETWTYYNPMELMQQLGAAGPTA